MLRPSDTPTALAQAKCPQVRGDVVLDNPCGRERLAPVFRLGVRGVVGDRRVARQLRGSGG